MEGVGELEGVIEGVGLGVRVALSLAADVALALPESAESAVTLAETENCEEAVAGASEGEAVPESEREAVGVAVPPLALCVALPVHVPLPRSAMPLPPPPLMSSPALGEAVLLIVARATLGDALALPVIVAAAVVRADADAEPLALPPDGEAEGEAEGERLAETLAVALDERRALPDELALPEPSPPAEALALRVAVSERVAVAVPEPLPVTVASATLPLGERDAVTVQERLALELPVCVTEMEGERVGARLPLSVALPPLAVAVALRSLGCEEALARELNVIAALNVAMLADWEREARAEPLRLALALPPLAVGDADPM
jgi:hypothetical protein